MAYIPLPEIPRFGETQRKLKKNARSLPILRLVSTSGQSARKPRRRRTFAALSLEYVSIPQPARLPHTLPSMPPPASPRKLRSTWSSADFGNALLLSDAPILLLPCVEEDDDDGSAGVDLFPQFDRKPRRVTDSVAVVSSVATVTSLVVPARRRSGGGGKLKGVDRRATMMSAALYPPSAFNHDDHEGEKTLRRRGGITQLRMSAPSSLPSSSPTTHASRRPLSHTSTASSIASTSSSIPITQFQSHSHSHSKSLNTTLRPYYSSVIRKDTMMAARPSTSHDFRPARPVSPFNIIPRSISPPTFDWEKPPCYTPGEFGYIPPTAAYHASGFSLSGETELRMALADDDAGSYKYKDMRKRGVRMRVKQLIRDKLAHFRKF